MTTEIQIKRDYSHMRHLRRIVSFIGGTIGMTGREIEDTERAVTEACLASMDDRVWNSGGTLPDGCLSVRVSADDGCMTIAITHAADDDDSPAQPGRHSHMLERIRDLADAVELVRGDVAETIFITKYAARVEQHAGTVDYASV